MNMRIRADVPLHVGATAELRSATPLGDVFVAIKPDPDQAPDAPLLRDGDTISLKSTAAAPTIEELLSSMAMLVNGAPSASWFRSSTGRVSCGRTRRESGRAAAAVNTLLSRLNARSEQLDTALRSTSELAANMAARHDTLDDAHRRRAGDGRDRRQHRPAGRPGR